MRFPTNSIIVNKSMDDAFALLLSPDIYLPLLKNEYQVKVTYDKRTPMEIGKRVKLIAPSEKGQLIVDLELSRCAPPNIFRYDIVSVNGKKGKPIPIFMFIDKMFIEVNFRETKDGARTMVVFSTYVEGLRGILTKAFAYIFLGISSWVSSRKYFSKLAKAVDAHA